MFNQETTNKAQQTMIDKVTLQYQTDAQTMFKVYQSKGQSAAEAIYKEIVNTKKLKLWEAKALSNEFFKLVKGV